MSLSNLSSPFHGLMQLRVKLGIAKYLDSFNFSGALEQAGELGTVDAERKISDEEFEVRSVAAVVPTVLKDVFLLVEIGRDGDISDEPRR